MRPLKKPTVTSPSSAPSLGKTPKGSSFHKKMLISVAALGLLIGGSLFLKTAQETPIKDQGISKTLETKAQFVRLLGQIKDPSDTGEHSHTIGQAIEKNHQTEEEEKLKAQQSSAVFNQISQDEEAQHAERLRKEKEILKDSVAQDRSQAPASRDTQAAGLSERQRMLNSQAQMLSVSNEVESRQKAQDDLSKQRIQEQEAKLRHEQEKSRKMARSKVVIEGRAPARILHRGLARIAPNIYPESSEFGDFRGALAKCNIHGHDVHWINDQGGILSHVLKREVLEGTKAMARRIIHANETLVVVVFEKGYEVYQKDGKLIEKKSFD